MLLPWMRGMGAKRGLGSPIVAEDGSPPPSRVSILSGAGIGMSMGMERCFGDS